MLENYIETNKGNTATAFNTVMPVPDSDERAYLQHVFGRDVDIERLNGTAASTAKSVMAALGVAQIHENLRSAFGHQTGGSVRGKTANFLDRTIADLEEAGLDATDLKRLKARRSKGARKHMEPKALAAGLDLAYDA